MEDSWSEKLSRLLEEDQRFSTLNEIKENLEALSENEADRAAKQIQLPLIFDCLNGSNEEQVELACDVLSLCMSHLSLGESTNRYDIFLERALKHPSVPVKLMALNEIERGTTSEQVLIDFGRRTSLVSAVIENIAHDDLSVAKKAADVIEKLGTTQFGLMKILSDDLIKVLNDILDTNEVVRLRVFEILVNISKKSEMNQELLQSSGLLNLLFKDLDNNDVLLRINVMELLTSLVVTKHGYKFLKSQGFIEKIFSQLNDDADPVFSQLSEPAILKFFGCMVSSKPVEMLSKYSKVLDRIFDNLNADDLILYGVSVDTFGFIVRTNQGKTAIDSLAGDKTEKAAKLVVDRIVSLPTELKIRSLKAVENLLRAPELDSAITSLTYKWYKAMGEDVMDKILSYAKNPFGEIRFAGLNILLTVAPQLWAQSIISTIPGLLEFLLDRSVETVKESKEVKYEIIKVLSTSSEFDNFTHARLKNFVKEGPFYVQAVVEVAIEGND